MFAAHTNFDSCATGTNAQLAQRLQLQHIVPMIPDATNGAWGMGRVGDLPQPVSLQELACQVRTLLQASTLRIAGDPQRILNRVAVCTGAGLMVEEALSAGAQVIITGDVKHHAAAQAVGQGLCVIDAGHYETEQPAIGALITGLQSHYNKIKYNARKAEITEFRPSRAEKPVLFAPTWDI